MLFDTGCGPSRGAVSFIESAPRLKAIFEAHSLLISPPISITRFPDIADWNSEHPRLRNYIAYSIWDWPLFDHLRTPTFYFLEDGRLRGKFSGWTGPSVGEAALVEGMRSIGLAPRGLDKSP
jgi:hypothetical protein